MTHASEEILNKNCNYAKMKYLQSMFANVWLFTDTNKLRGSGFFLKIYFKGLVFVCLILEYRVQSNL